MPYDVEGSLADIFRAIEHEMPARPTRATAGIDRELEAIILRTIAKAPPDRYQSVESLRADLMRYLRGDPLEARGHHPLYVMSRVVRRHKGPVLIGSAFVIVTLAFGITMGLMYRASEHEAARAEHVQRFLQDMLVSASPFRTSANLTVVEVLRQAAERIPQDLHGHPEAEAGVRYTIGQVYAGLWMWEDAEPHLRRALDLSRTLHGDRHEDVAACLSLLGRALTFRGDPGSVDLQREALDVRRDRFGPDHALVAEAHGNLGFAIWKTASPPAPTEAELHYRQAMRTYRAAHRAAVDPDDEAITASRARITYSYAVFCLDHDRLVEADRLFAQASRLYRAMAGSGDVYMTECLDAYATCLFRLRRYDEAAALLRESIALRPPGFASGRLVEAVWLLGTIERLSSSWDEALRHYDLALAMQCEILATRDANAPFRLRLLGSALREPGRSDPLYVDVFRLLRETQPGVMPQLAAAMLDVANALRGQQRAAVAEPLLRECVDLLTDPAYEQSYLAGLAHSEYGACLMDLSRGRDAGAHLLEGGWILQQRASRADPYYELAVRRVVRYYEFNGQPADAARYEALLDEPAPGPARLTE
jgi:tetratricopeptide (TPR) repeat protein